MMLSKLKTRTYALSPVIIAIALLLAFFYTRGFFGNHKSKIIFSDGIGYYCYLPANLIYHDRSCAFMPAVFHQYYDKEAEAADMAFMRNIDGSPLNQFFAGTAILMLPFFLMAHVLSLLSGMPADGFSLYYQYFIAIGSIFWCWLGCVFAFRLMRLFSVTPAIAALALVLTVFGTNLYYYTLYEPAMSHVYSFMTVSGFLFCSARYFKTLRTRSFLLSLFFAGLIVLIRPSNALVFLLIPFAAGNRAVLLSGIKNLISTWPLIIATTLIPALLFFIQCWLWHQQTGSWFVWSYQGQSFDFSNPHILAVLFSFKKGLFLYTPLTAMSLAGLFWLFLNKRLMFWWSIIFMIATVFVVSSWWNWWYGMSFGHRAFIDYYVLLAVFLAFALSSVQRSVLKYVLVLLCTLFLVLNQIQTYQYRYFILHWETMTAEKYHKVFLKTGREYRGMLWKDSDNKTREVK